MRMMSTREWGWAVLLTILVILLVMFAIIKMQEEKDECEERGGRIVKLRNSRDGAWFCQEPK